MSIEEVREQFDLPRLQAFTEYSKRFPPLHIMIAGYFGLGKKDEPADDEFINELLVMFPA